MKAAIYYGIEQIKIQDVEIPKLEPVEVNLGRIVWSEAMVTGSNCYAYSGLKTDFQAAVELITSGKVEPTKLVTHRFPLDEITEAFRVAADKRSGSIKVHVCQ